MRRQLFFGTVLAAAMAVGLGAQSTDASSQTTAKHQKASANASVTLTGCVEASDLSGTSTTGTTGSATKAAKHEAYMLTDVSTSASASASESATSAGENVQLEGKGLAKHDGHKVEVRGHWVNNSGANMSTSGTSGSTAGTSGTSSANSSMAANGAQQTFKVTSVRSVSGTCSGK